MATELGVGYLSILPDFSKLPGAVAKGFGSAAKGAAQVFGKGVDKNLGGVAKSFAAAGKNAGEALAKSALAAAKSDIAKLSKQMASATDAQANALGRLRVAQAKLDGVRANSKSTAAQLAAAEEAVATAQRKANTATAAAKGVTDKLAAAQDKAKTAADDLAKAQADAANKSTKFGSKAGQAFTSAFRTGFNAKQAASDNLGKIDGSREGRGVATRFGAGFNGLFGGIVTKSAALLAATFATVGIGSLVTDAVNLEATFSQTMNTMAAVAKVPAAGIKDLSALALQMGKDTTFSAGEAATAMLELAKGGLDAATIKAGGLQGTLTLAAAGGTDLATAAGIASNALNTFNLKGSDMTSVAAALAGGANASTASIESLGEALGQVGPGATNAGLSLQDTVGVLAAFDSAGIKGTDAGTSLKTMLTRLVPSTNAARNAMKDLGLKFTDANGAFLPITNVAEQLRKKLGGLSAEQRTAALSTIFGSDATRAATVLMNEGSAGIGKYIAATKDQNAANEVAAARMSGTAGAIENFKGSIETAKIQLGQFLAPTVQAGLGKLTTLVNGVGPAFKNLAAAVASSGLATAFQSISTVAGKVFTELRGSVFAFISSFKANDGDITSSGLPGFFERVGFTARQVFDALKNDVVPVVKTVAGNLKNDLLPPVVSVAQKLGQVAGTIVTAVGPAFASFTGFLRENATLVGAIAAGVLAMVVAYKAYQLTLTIVSAVGKAFAAVQLLINTVMSLNPISIVVLAVIGLVAALIYAYKHSETFRNIVNGAFSAVRDTAVAVFDAVKSAVVTAINFVRDHWKLIVAIIGGPFVALVLLVTTYWDQIKAAFSTAVSAVLGALRATWGLIGPIITGPLNLVISVIQAVWSRVSPILVLPFYIAKAVITTIFNGIAAAFTAVKDWVVTTFSKAWAAVSGVLSGPINTAKTWIGQRWAEIQLGFTVAKAWVTTTFAKAWSAVTGAISKPIDAAKTWIGQRWAEIKLGFTAIKDWVTGAFSKAWNAVKEKLSKPISDARDLINTVLSANKNGLQWIFDQAVKGIGKIWNGLQELAKAPIRFIVNTVLNDGLIDSFNWIAGKFQAPTIPRFNLPKGFADGGYNGQLPGPASAVDNMLGMTAAGRAVGLASGEFIVNAKDTSRALPWLRHVNNGGALPGFADGGLFGKLKGAVSGAFNAGKSFGSDAIGFLSDPVKWFKDKLAGPLGRLNEIGNSPIAQTVKAVPRKIVDVVTSKAKDLLGIGGGKFNPGLQGALDFARSQAGKPYMWGASGPIGYDCSGFISALVNVALGRDPFHRLFATGNMPNGVFEPGPGAFSVGWFRGNPGHTAGTINGTNVESRGGQGVVVGPSARGATNSLFNSGVWHLPGFAAGGLIGDGPFDELDPRGKAFRGKALVPSSALAFDTGQGQLPEGWSAVFNGTGAPEPLTRTDRAMDLSDEAIDKLAAAVALRNARLDVRDVDDVLIGSMRTQAKKVQDGTASALVHEHGLRD